MTNPAPPSPSVSAIVLRTVRAMPKRHRRVIWLNAFIWVILSVLQFWDIRDKPGFAGQAEFASVVLGTLGFMAVAFVQVLRGVTQSTSKACVPNLADAPGPEMVERPVAVRQILMSLPLIAGIAAVCLSAAVAFIVGRLWFEWRVILVFVAIFYTAAAGIALYLARDASRRLYEFAQAESARASRIETELASARLAALQAQMHPHFLFNALNTVASLTQTDPRAAETTVEQLADVLRVALDRTDQPMSTVDDEIRFVRAYIGVESQRYGDRLSVKWQIDPSLNRAAVPSFSLQPLVENAIKHGLSGRAKGGRMIVSVQREPDDRIALAVDDDGDGFAANAPEGTGLSNLRRRLDALYGGAASLHVERRNPGARVVIRVPARLGSDTGLPCACS